MDGCRKGNVAFRAWLATALAAVLSVPDATATGVLDVSVTFFRDDVVRVVKVPQGGKKPTASFVVTRRPEAVDVTRTCSNGVTTYASEKLKVSVDGAGLVTFSTASGLRLLAEEKTVFVPRKKGDPDEDAFSVLQQWRLPGDEPIYGLGIIQDESISRRNMKRTILQDNIEDYSPVLQSVNGWGLFWNNPSVGEYEDRENVFGFNSEIGDNADYYFMYAGSSDGVVRQIRWLSGEVPMQPKWTLGYYVSRERYTSWKQLAEIVDEHRRRAIPMDCIVQDWQYWGGNETWNALDFLADGYVHDPAAGVKAIHDRHAKLMISVWPGFGPKTKPYVGFRSRGWCLKNFETWPKGEGVIVYDAFNPKARDLYWQYMRRLADCGVDAWWMDSTEPDHWPRSGAGFDTGTYLGSYRRICNLFPLFSVAGVYDHQRADDPAGRRRVSIMTRSCYTGMQRTGANTWSGDVESKWETLRMQIPAGLGFGLTGNPNFNTDIGGFHLWRYGKGRDAILKNSDFIELNVRWMQYALFNPIFRSHGTDAPREIWRFGDCGDRAYEAMTAAVRMRYRFLPYLYSMARWVSFRGGTMMRPLFADYNADPVTWLISDQFLFGTEMMSAPVVHSQATSRRLYLPSGVDWYDFWTKEKIAGGRWITPTVTLDSIPLYAKAGAIVPMGPIVQYVDEVKNPDVELLVFPGKDGSLTLYDDEGDGYGYEGGRCAEIPVTWNDSSRVLCIGIRNGSYPGMPTSRRFVVRVVDAGAHAVVYTGNSVELEF